MKATFASLLVAILPALTVVRGGTDGCDFARGISLTCGDFILADDGNTLSANCVSASNPGGVYTTLHLDDCLANYDGQISLSQNGSFTQSCSDCILKSPTKTLLQCECGNGKNGDDGKPLLVTSIFDLNNATHFKNDDGTLQCSVF